MKKTAEIFNLLIWPFVLCCPSKTVSGLVYPFKKYFAIVVKIMVKKIIDAKIESNEKNNFKTFCVCAESLSTNNVIIPAVVISPVSKFNVIKIEHIEA